MAKMVRVSICAVLLLAVGTHAAQVTPMEKVITLLKSLSAKVAAEGKKEAAQYDKFACFCKEQADEKLYSIEKSENTIASQSAQIKELDTAIAELNSDISALGKKASKLESDIKDMTDKRDKDHAAYLVKAKDMNEAIDACGRAIGALKDSKTSMKGAKVDFAQVQKAAQGLLGVSPESVSSVPGAVTLLAQLNGKAAPKFEYQSNDIIATLNDLLTTFKSMKQKLDFEESDINSAFESKKLGLSNERTFAEKEKNEKEAIVEGKTETVNGVREDREEETKDMNADQKFLDKITEECNEKALLWDQRSKTRSEELTALSDATAELEKGAVPNFSANKKLVGIAVKSVVKKAAVAPVSFVQINNVNYDQSKHQVIVKKVLEFLHGAAGRTGSNVLANVAMRVKLSEDHFVKVRALIKDLIQKLKDDAKAEATHKSFCDEGMRKNVAKRDEANAKIEVANAKITSFTAKSNELQDQISQLEADNAALQKSLLEATELRNDDKADHSKTEGMSEEAIESVKKALQLLQTFYNKALVQTKKYTPPNSDRDGNTVGDLAPEVFDEKYHASQTESKGIIGILEVILSDFERTKKKTLADEAESQKHFEELEKETKEDIAEKTASIKKKEGENADTKSDIIDQQQALSDAQDQLASAQDTLDGLKAMCVAGEETWEERKKKREEEIEALKDAYQIFEDWQK